MVTQFIVFLAPRAGERDIVSVAPLFAALGLNSGLEKDARNVHPEAPGDDQQ